MSFKKLLIANRGEIAIRIAQAAAELGIATVGMHSEDDATSLHVRRVDKAIPIKGKGAAAYLDIAWMIAAAKKAGCDSVHPGYGFLSENADFAEACVEARITFVGPTPEQLKLFGDKARARAQAAKCKVPVLPGTDVTDLAGAVAFFKKHAKAGIVLKAIAGGGGRGMRLIKSEGEITDAFARASAEAKSAFGNGAFYAERLVGRARHIEVQIVGDGKGGIVALGERECTLQRRSQKIVERPAPRRAERRRVRASRSDGEARPLHVRQRLLVHPPRRMGPAPVPIDADRGGRRVGEGRAARRLPAGLRPRGRGVPFARSIRQVRARADLPGPSPAV
jgi:acetyl/propionyl-CoA carboxylase alpha subunit